MKRSSKEKWNAVNLLQSLYSNACFNVRPESFSVVSCNLKLQFVSGGNKKALDKD